MPGCLSINTIPSEFPPDRSWGDLSGARGQLCGNTLYVQGKSLKNRQSVLIYFLSVNLFDMDPGAYVMVMFPTEATEAFMKSTTGMAPMSSP